MKPQKPSSSKSRPAAKAKAGTLICYNATKALEQISELANSADVPLHWITPVLGSKEFAACPASRGYHHAGPGGLAVHTAEVLRFALAAAAPLGRLVNLQVLGTACVWHDWAKIHEYRIQYTPAGRPTEITVTDYHKLIHHISGSHAAFLEHMKSGLRPKHYSELQNSGVLRDICHCILAHHGRHEWHSPVLPATLEALLVHQADMLSVMYDQTLHPQHKR